MKNLLKIGIAFCLMALSFYTANAQVTANKLKSPLHPLVFTDTVSTTVKYQLTGPVIGFADVLTFQVVVTKISGTVAGSIVLQGTLDGVNWLSIGSAVTPTDVATQSFAFSPTAPAHAYIQYRISYTPTGTMSAKLNSYYIARKRTN